MKITETKKSTLIAVLWMVWSSLVFCCFEQRNQNRNEKNEMHGRATDKIEERRNRNAIQQLNKLNTKENFLNKNCLVNRKTKNFFFLAWD